VLGYVQTAPSTGFSTFRCVFEASKLENQPEMEWFFDGISGARSVLAENEERFRNLFIFPCRNGSLINVVAYHPDDREQDRDQDQYGA
jgi:salicylate hydroxylase